MIVEVLWAQALDNTGDDLIEASGERLIDGDDPRRQAAVGAVSNVTMNGTRIHESRGVMVAVLNDQVVLRLYTTSLDRAGRIAPIVCLASFDTSVTDSDAEMLMARIREFAVNIGRDVAPEVRTTATRALATVKKKARGRLPCGCAALGASGLVASIVVIFAIGQSW